MAKKIGVLFIAVAVITFSGGMAGASTVIWDNGDTDGGRGRHIDDFFDLRFEAADDFFFADPTVITDVHFTAVGYSSFDWGPIEWTVYNDVENGFFHPAGIYDTGFAENTQITPLADDRFNVSFDLDHSVLWPGIDWGWLGLHLPGEDGNVLWATTGLSTGESAVSQVGFTGWEQIGSDLAFQLTGIPEPSTLLLLGTGLLGVVGLARRRKS